MKDKELIYENPEVTIVEINLHQVISASPEAGETEDIGFENW